jgi:hypothetical protein
VITRCGAVGAAVPVVCDHGLAEELHYGSYLCERASSHEWVCTASADGPASVKSVQEGGLSRPMIGPSFGKATRL